jgi:hypothetical protein
MLTFLIPVDPLFAQLNILPKIETSCLVRYVIIPFISSSQTRGILCVSEGWRSWTWD